MPPSGLSWNPLAINIAARLAPPSAVHWLGTDEFGRDVLSRVMAGAETSTGIALGSVFSAVLFGSLVGMLAGYRRGWTERVLMSFTDALLAFPSILLALAVLAVLGAGSAGLVGALALSYAPAVARVVRGTVLSIRTRDFVEASRMIGNSELYTMGRHVLPNAFAPIAILATAMLAWVLLAESALSFLGLGVQPPAPSWGNMLANGRAYMQEAAWLELAPGLAIVLSVLGVNLLGDALRDRLDPRSQPLA